MTCSIKDYAFGAYNSSPHASTTYLTARILSRKNDEELLRLLACDQEVYINLAHRNLKYGEPSGASLGMALGPERGFMQESDCAGPDGTRYPRVPLSTLGVTQREQVDSLLRNGERDERSPFRTAADGLSLYLRPGEMQQVFLRLIPKDPKVQAAYTVQIDHWLSADKKEYIGGLTAMFLTPHDPF
jgi:hypothetical protein